MSHNERRKADGLMPEAAIGAPLCPVNCNGGCPVCAPEDHTGSYVYTFIRQHFTLTPKTPTYEPWPKLSDEEVDEIINGDPRTCWHNS